MARRGRHGGYYGTSFLPFTWTCRRDCRLKRQGCQISRCSLSGLPTNAKVFVDCYIISQGQIPCHAPCHDGCASCAYGAKVTLSRSSAVVLFPITPGFRSARYYLCSLA